jgi:predicted transcriptional regulator with HTH domain
MPTRGVGERVAKGCLIMNNDEYFKIITKLYKDGCVEISKFQEMMIGKDVETTLAILGDVEITVRDGVECIELTEKAQKVIEELTRGKT